MIDNGDGNKIEHSDIELQFSDIEMLIKTKINHYLRVKHQFIAHVVILLLGFVEFIDAMHMVCFP